ncbi:MAG: UPF0175 family protein [Limnospira sp.]
MPEQSLTALNLTPEQMDTKLRLAAAIKFYELGRLSSKVRSIRFSECDRA